VSGSVASSALVAVELDVTASDTNMRRKVAGSEWILSYSPDSGHTVGSGHPREPRSLVAYFHELAASQPPGATVSP
jgi:hypothetical protein